MSSPEIQSVLNQMQVIASQAGGSADKGARQSVTVGDGGFADTLYGAVQRINQLQQVSGVKAEAFQAGAPGVSLHDVMVDGQKASLAFELGVQVRNRLVTAYKDIMNLQI